MAKPSFVTGFVFCVNLIMGTGGLALPYAFFHAGYILGALAIAASAFCACVTICWHFEGQLRAYMLMEVFRHRRVALVPKDQKAAAAAVAAHAGNNTAHQGGTGAGQCDGHGAASDDQMHEGACDDARLAAHGEGLEFMAPARRLSAMPRPGDDPSSEAGEETVNAAYEEGGDAPLLVTPRQPVFVATLTEAVARCGGQFTLEARGAPIAEHPLPEPDYDRFEPSMFLEVCDILTLFGGRYAVWVWNFALTAYVIATLWVYTVVLAETALLGIPLVHMTSRLECNTEEKDAFAANSDCTGGIRIYVAIFAALLSGLVMRDWSFMHILQKVFTACMYVILIIMTCTCFAGMSQHSFPGAHTQDEKIAGSFIQRGKLFEFSGFAGLFGTSIFAMICHTGSTYIIRHMPSKPLTKPVFRSAMGVVCIVYTVMSLVVSLYIGDKTDKLITLSWANYADWGWSGAGGQLIGGFVMFFPLFSVTAAYIITLRSGTDAMEFMIPLAWRVKYCSFFGREYVPFNATEGFSVWPLQFSLRAVLLGIGTVLALASYNFQSALSVASLLGFVVLFVVPLIVQTQSRRVLAALGQDPTTPYDDIFSSLPVSVVFAVVCAVAAVYYILSQLIPTLFHVDVI